MRKGQHTPILWIGFLVFAVSIAGMIAYAYLGTNTIQGYNMVPRWALSVTVIAVGIITFFGLLWYVQTQGGPLALHREGARLAIAASVITVDLVLVGMVSFFISAPDGGNDLPALTQTMLTNFTAVVVSVVGFYFGASAYVQVRREGETRTGEPQAD